MNFLLIIFTLFIIQTNNDDDSDIYATALNYYFDYHIHYPNVFTLNLIDETYLPSHSNTVVIQENTNNAGPFQDGVFEKHDPGRKVYNPIITSYKELIGKRGQLSINKKDIEYEFKIVKNKITDTGDIENNQKGNYYYFSPIIQTTKKDEVIVILTNKAGREFLWHAFLLKKSNETYKVLGEQYTDFSVVFD